MTVAAISRVFTISRVAEMLGENEDWLHELSIDMSPKTAACTSSKPVARP